MIIENGQDVNLVVDGVPTASYSFDAPVVGGEVGLGTWNAFSFFDNVTVAAYSPPPGSVASWPLFEDFEDGDASYFEFQTGSWTLANGRMHADGAGHAIASVRAQVIPCQMRLKSSQPNADSGGGGLYSNAFVIFDYQSETDFKFAGSLVGSGKWVIGHRSGSSWITDVEFLEPVAANTDYHVQAVVEDMTAT